MTANIRLIEGIPEDGYPDVVHRSLYIADLGSHLGAVVAPTSEHPSLSRERLFDDWLPVGLTDFNSLEASSRATEVAALYFGFLLSAAAIIFAISFADARQWPSIRRIVHHCFLQWWLALGALATLGTWLGNIAGWPVIAFVASMVWILAGGLGTLSLVRIVRLSNSQLMVRMMSDHLVRSFSTPRHHLRIKEFRRATMEALASGDLLKIRDLTEQVAHLRRRCPTRPAATDLELDFVREVTSATLLQGLDGRTSARAIRLSWFPIAADTVTTPTVASSNSLVDQFVRFPPELARIEARCRLLNVEGICTAQSAIPLRAAAINQHEKFVDLFDPEPKADASSPAKPIVLTPDQSLACYRALTIRSVPNSHRAAYGLYQRLTGQRYPGNFWEGAPLLADTIRDSPQFHDVPAALEFIVAEQLVTCTSSLTTENHHRWYQQDDHTVVTAVCRIAISLGPVGGVEGALTQFQDLLTVFDPSGGIYRNGLPAPQTMAIVAGLVLSLMLRTFSGSGHRTEVADAFLRALPVPAREAAGELVRTLSGNSQMLPTTFVSNIHSGMASS